MDQNLMDDSGWPVLLPTYGLVLLGLILVLGLVIARRRGKIKGNGGLAIGIVVVVGIIAFLLWLGPALFLI